MTDWDQVTNKLLVRPKDVEIAHELAEKYNTTPENVIAIALKFVEPYLEEAQQKEIDKITKTLMDLQDEE